MNRLLLLPGIWTHEPMLTNGTRTGERRDVRVFIVAQEKGRSLIVLREDVPDFSEWIAEGWEVHLAPAGRYFEIADESVRVDLLAVEAMAA